MRTLALALAMLLLAFAFLPAAAAGALGVQTLRMVAFSLVLLALAAVTLAWRPALPAPHTPGALWLLLGLALLGLLDLRHAGDPIAWKLALPVLALLVAPRLALMAGPERVALAAWRLLSAYVLATAATLLLGGGEAALRGHDAVQRLDATGSMVAHGSLCAVHVAVAAQLLADRSTRRLDRTLAIVAGLAALAMALLSGTRSVLAIWALALLFAWTVGPAPVRRRTVATGLALVLAFVLHTAFVSPTLLLRLQGAGEFSSGRAASIGVWLAAWAEQPLGIGLGGIRTALADGRPALDGQQLLEWPHNEPVRLLVEGGPVGLVVVLGLLVLLLGQALRGAAHSPSPVVRALLVALAADILAESLLQNFLNGVYQATAFALLVGTLATPLPLGRRGAPG